MFNLLCRDVMLILNLTLSATEKPVVLGKVREFGNEHFISYAEEIADSEERKGNFSIGQEAVPPVDPQWSPETQRHKIKHCQFYIIEGLRHSETKPVNYCKLTTISQGTAENTSAFFRGAQGGVD